MYGGRKDKNKMGSGERVKVEGKIKQNTHLSQRRSSQLEGVPCSPLVLDVGSMRGLRPDPTCPGQSRMDALHHPTSLSHGLGPPSLETVFVQAVTFLG